MIIINMVVLFGLFTAIILCVLKSSDILSSINKKEHSLYLLYPLADYLIKKTPLGNLLMKKNNKSNTMKALYATGKPEQLSLLYWCSKISLTIVIIILFDLISLFSQLADNSNSSVMNGGYLQRPEQGEGSRQVDLRVSMEKAKTNSSADQYNSLQAQEVRINVEERRYTGKELDSIMDNAIKYLEAAVLANNKSFDNIVSDLNFINKIPRTSVSVDWIPEDTALIEADGKVHNQNVGSRGILTRVTVLISCQDRHTEYIIPLHLMRGRTSKVNIRDQLNQELLQASKDTASDRLFKLPETLGAYRLTWSDHKKDNTGMLFFFGIVCAFAIWLGMDRELDSKMKKRKNQMLIDYPELINKFTLLINAGMTIRQAWNKITSDYCAISDKEKDSKRYAYEEMLVTVNELKLGIPEQEAYEQYGRRIGLIPYIKFSSLMTQNLKKGTRGFTELLTREAREAFEERKEIARRLGEEAGTKLLIPMMVLLIMVFLIIMIPAFMAFRI